MAVAAITHWLESRPQPPSDGDALLRKMSQVVGALRATPRIRDDAAALAITDAMALDGSMEVVMDALERLDDRLRARRQRTAAARPRQRMLLKL